MFSRLILVFLFLIQIVFPNESSSDNFFVVSTTNSPAPKDNTEELATKLKSLESQNVVMQKLLDAYNSQLSHLKEDLQTQVVQNQKTLDTYNSNLSHLKEHHETQVAQNKKTLDAHTSDLSYLKENLQIRVVKNEKTLDAYNSDLSHFKDNLQTQFDKIQKKLENIESNLLPLKNPIQSAPTNQRQNDQVGNSANAGAGKVITPNPIRQPVFNYGNYGVKTRIPLPPFQYENQGPKYHSVEMEEPEQRGFQFNGYVGY